MEIAAQCGVKMCDLAVLCKDYVNDFVLKSSKIRTYNFEFLFFVSAVLRKKKGKLVVNNFPNCDIEILTEKFS